MQARTGASPDPALEAAARGDAQSRWIALWRFAAVALQVALLVGVIRAFALENEALGKVAALALGGFVVHHWLPARLQLPFFALLSVASVFVALPGTAAAFVVAAGALLVGLCHLPVPFGWRVALILAAAAALLGWRMEWIPGAPTDGVRIWPILGSMFMFRLIVYLYDLRHRAAPFDPWHAVSYFFMVPNAAMPLFPVVDYKTFCRSRFNDDAIRIYQVGVRWIFRGVVHLLLYQVVYLFLVVDPAEAVDAGDALQYVTTTFALYLRVSGTFHVIVGMLHLFGFNLPETHHLFFLSRSFTDFWRRINIYWKDFLTKVIFYPAYFRLKRYGEVRATAFATAIAFVATWLLHSYQWLWLRGDFPLTWRDAVFWLGLGGLVVLNLLWERRRAPKRAIGTLRLGPREALVIGLQTAGTFTALALLWTVWSTPAASLATLAAAASNVTPGSVAALLAGLAGIGAAGVLLANSKREDTAGARLKGQAPMKFWPSVAGIVAASAALLAVGRHPELLAGISPRLAEAAVAVKRDKLNRIDLLGRERSYYQDLGDVRFNAPVGGIATPQGWGDNAAKLLRDDFLLWEYAPNRSIEYKEARFATNRHGMRDRNYEPSKAPDTLRIALAGSSHEVGSGVPEEATYENRVEALLNASPPAGAPRRYEILNFAVEGNPPLQKLASVEQRAFAFKPDIVLYAAHSNEIEWIPRRLAEIINRDVPIPYPEVAALMARAGIAKGMRDDEVHRRLRPHREELLGWIFRRLDEQARARGARAAVVLVEKAEDRARPEGAEKVAALAREAGLPLIDLWGAFDGIAPRESLYVAPWDSHPNARGHGLLADRLHRGLVESGLLQRP